MVRSELLPPTFSLEGYRDPYWFFLLELLELSPLLRHLEKEPLVLGRSDPDDDCGVDINLYPYGQKSGVSREHLFLDLNEKEFWVANDTTNPTFFIDKEKRVSLNEKRSLIDGGDFHIGEVQIIIKFVSHIGEGKDFRLTLQRYGIMREMSKESISDSSDNIIFDYDRDSLSDETVVRNGVVYPKKIVERAEKLMERLIEDGENAIWEEAIEAVIAIDEASRNPQHIDDDFDVFAVNIPSTNSSSDE